MRTLSKDDDGNDRTWIDELEDIEHVLDVKYPTTANGNGIKKPQFVLRTGMEAPFPSEWETPVGFTALDLPPFPIEALPSVLADFVRAEAEFSQTPLDMAGMLSLAACAAAIGRAAIVEVKPDYREPMNLFVAVVLPPGERKSAVLSSVTQPLEDWERKETERLKPQIAHAQMKLKTIEKMIDTQQRNAAKAKSTQQLESAEAEIEKLTDRMTELKLVVPPRILCDDATPEALVSLMAQSGARAAQFSAEGGVFSMLGGRYSDKVNLDAYLKGHAGDNIRVDRKGRPSEFVEKPALTLGLAVQPSVLESLADNPQFRGVGLLARFLYSLPASKLGKRRVDTQAMPAVVRAEYNSLLERMLTLPRAFDGVQLVMKMNDEARKKHFDFAAWVEPQLAEFSEFESIRDWAAKLTGSVARLAGVFSVVRVVSPRSKNETSSIYIGISSDDIDRAITVGRYLVQHALGAFQAMGMDERVADAKQALRCVSKNGWDSFTRSQLQQQLRHSIRFKDGDKVDAVLKVLEERRFIRPVPVERRGETGRKPGPAFDVNPFFVLTDKNAKNADN